MKAACPCKWSQSGGTSSEGTAALKGQQLAFAHQPSLNRPPTMNQNPAELPLQGTGRLGDGVYNPSHSTPSPAGEKDIISC